MDLQQIKVSVLANMAITPDTVSQLRAAIYEDATVDTEELDLVCEFENNDEIEKCAEWDGLYADVVSDHYASDKDFDPTEAEDYKNRVLTDGIISNAEKLAYAKIKAMATDRFTEIPELEAA